MERFTELQDAVDRLAGVDPAGLSDDELRDALLRVHREEARLTAIRTTLLAELDARGAHWADGSKTAAMWLGRHTRAPLGECRAQVRLARRLADMPHTQAALAAGEIGERHAQVLAGLAGSPRQPVAEGFAGAEQGLVDKAKTLGFGDFVRAIRTWEDTVDEDGAEDQARHDHAARRLQLHQTLRGTWQLTARLDALAGTELATAIERIERELFEADWAEAKAIHGDNTGLEHLTRTGPQRRADALVELARRAMAAPPGARLPEPLITVLVGYETFAGRTCELANNGTVVTPGQVASLLTRAYIERAVFDGPSRVIDVGVRERFFTGGLRRAIEIRDRHCTHPGCTTPAEWCQVDHIVPYSEGGLTTQANGRLHCPRHNNRRNKGRRGRARTGRSDDP